MLTVNYTREPLATPPPRRPSKLKYCTDFNANSSPFSLQSWTKRVGTHGVNVH